MKNDFESFKECMEQFIATEKLFDALDDATKDLNLTGYGLSIDGHGTLAMRLMEVYFEDGGDWIAYWYYDLDKGKKWKAGTVKDKEGRDMRVKTLRDLWKVMKTE